MKKKILSLMLMVSLAASLAACGQDRGKNSNSTDLSKTETEASSGQTGEEETTLVYGSADYTRINPAMDEHGEINLLLFNGHTMRMTTLFRVWQKNGSTMQKPAPTPFISGMASNGMMEKNLRRMM
mgnify:CR=1 FL=1